MASLRLARSIFCNLKFARLTCFAPVHGSSFHCDSSFQWDLSFPIFLAAMIFNQFNFSNRFHRRFSQSNYQPHRRACTTLLALSLLCTPATFIAQTANKSVGSNQNPPATPNAKSNSSAKSNSNAKPTPPPSTAPARRTVLQQAAPAKTFNFSDYGASVAPDARLILVMAALDAAGFNPTPEDAAPPEFRAQTRAAYANLDENLKRRLTTFRDSYVKRNGLELKNGKYDSNLLARQAAPFVSLALTLGNAPNFVAPSRTDDLPSEVLEVLDFAALVQEFYARSGIAANLPALLKTAQAEADAMRPAAATTIYNSVAYLRTQPETTFAERVVTTAAAASSSSTKKPKDKNARSAYTVREGNRRFVLMPDSLGVPGTINFRIIGDDYFVALAPGASPASSEVRRAYLQFVVEPLVRRFNTQVAARRADIKILLDTARANLSNPSSPNLNSVSNSTASSAKTSAIASSVAAAVAAAGGSSSGGGGDANISASDILISNAEVFPAVTRSLVAAADARIEELTRRAKLMQDNDRRLAASPSPAERTAIARENQTAQQAIADRTMLSLSEAYERGAILAFYFAEGLRGIEDSGFDLSSLLPDLISSFNTQRELTRFAEAKASAARALEARRNEAAENAARRGAAASNNITEDLSPTDLRNQQLAQKLKQVQQLLSANNYTQAESQLLALRSEYQADARILFALGQTASAAASDATDESVRDERLKRALANYRLSIDAVRASGDTDSATNRALMSRAYVLIARIYEFQENKAEAESAYDAAIKIGDVAGGSYREASAGKAKLATP